jgi:hypothetical protein
MTRATQKARMLDPSSSIKVPIIKKLDLSVYRGTDPTAFTVHYPVSSASGANRIEHQVPVNPRPKKSYRSRDDSLPRFNSAKVLDSLFLRFVYLVKKFTSGAKNYIFGMTLFSLSL